MTPRTGIGRLRRHAWVLALGVAACSDKDPSGPPAGDAGFSITVRYIGVTTPSQRNAVERAVARWSAAIVKDIPDVPLTIAADACLDGQPAVQETVDDLLLFVHFASFDGPGGAIAQAGPCFVRSGSQLPLVGVLMVDRDDMSTLTRNGLLEDVMLHELGHVLGIGTVWTGLRLLSGAGGDDPQFTGAYASAVYHELAGLSGSVPVENTGGPGTRDGHWRESVFGNELMTGTLDFGGNPLSALSIQSLRDLGYATTTTPASGYTLPVAAARIEVEPGETLALHAHEVLIQPRFSR
ncbi:MAG TPA: leishmanolysin-related zinc metalloendopeptidase [Longimicrobiales bacterium]|nr:leishmanolysin-related zinc metalloendopeptidase [Longimicrobiales bacterium]